MTVPGEARMITIEMPFDGHVHGRTGPVLDAVAPYTIMRNRAALFMGNLKVLVASMKTGMAYAASIRERIPERSDFEPYLAMYLTDNTDPDELELCYKEGIFIAAKFMLKDVTTNSEHGMSSVEAAYPAFERMEKIGMPVAGHFETVWRDGKKVDHYEREEVFIDAKLIPLRKRFPGLKISFEHVSTKQGIQFVKSCKDGRTVGGVTLHHLWCNRLDVLEGGMSVYHHCLPVIKEEEHQLAIRKAATADDNDQLFAASDSAPHLDEVGKLVPRASGGITTAHMSVEAYIHVFEEERKLHNANKFLSVIGPKFYGLEPAKRKMTLVREPWTVDTVIRVPGGGIIRPFLYEENPSVRQLINWRIKAT